MKRLSKSIKKFKPSHWLALIIVIGALLRWVGIGEYPLGLTWDEASITYDAWGIMDWHRDHHARLMPLTFKSFGDYKAPLLHYILALVFYFSGVEVLAIRYISALAGICLIPSVYKLTGKILNETNSALWSAFLVAINPWAIHLSRVGFEANLALLFITIGIYYLVDFSELKKGLVGVFFLAMSIYTYQSPKIVAPLLLALLVNRWRRQNFRKIGALILAFLVLCIPFIYSLKEGGLARGHDVLIIFNDEGELRTDWDLINQIGNKAISHLSPGFLYLGEQNNLRNAIPNFSLMTRLDLVFLIVGLVGLFKRKSRYRILVLVWVLITLLPSILSNRSPHTLRATNVIVPSLILSALGVRMAVEFLAKRWQIAKAILTLLIVVIYGWQFINFAEYYMGEYRVESAKDFQYGHEQALKRAKQELKTANQMWMTDAYGQPYIFTNLFFNYKPEQFHAGANANIKYGKINWPNDMVDTVFVATPDEISPKDESVIQTIKVPDSDEILFVIARK